MNAPGRGLSRPIFVGAVAAASAALAAVFFQSGYRSVIYDSYHFLLLSQIVSAEGLSHLFSRVRTYGYPLFVAVATGFSSPSPDMARMLVAAAQVLLCLAVSFYAARVCERVFASRRVFAAVFALMALNPIVLIRSTELLTDSLSASLLAVALYASLEPRRPAPRALIAFLACGFAVAVRPANLAALPALAVLWILRARLYREPLGRSAALAVVAVAAALAPQLSSNVRGYGAWTPLLADRLYGAQAEWGTHLLKYGTLVVPGVEPQLVYENPLRPKGVSTPAGFLRESPSGYAATLALHGFAMVDQDLPFTYVTDPRPAYRWPLALANYAFLFLSIVGLTVLLVRERASPSGLYAAGATLLTAALVAVYLPVAVENRFSLPLYLLLPPAAIHAVRWLAGRRSGTIVAVAIAGGGFVAACVQISLWLTKQAPYLSSLGGR